MAVKGTVARSSYPVGSRGAKVTSDSQSAVPLAGEGTPVLLVGKDAEGLGRLLREAPDAGSRERFLGVMVGDLADPVVAAAAQEMARELWQWAEAGPSRPGPGRGTLGPAG